MPINLSDEMRGVPPPWDGFTCRQILFLRHRLALERQADIAEWYGITESAVRHAIGRVARHFLIKTEVDLLIMAERDGLGPLPLRDVEVACGQAE